ncbi:MAG: NUDIX hydrolase [Cypionkella sp.]|nr:NUDIX hydrolase [Cypionkella sp.]
MKRERADQFSATGADQPAHQTAALCWRLHRGRVQVLLITSRDTGRWILPKGWPMTGKSASEAAAQEAWEEAGVHGTPTAEPLGFYGYDKLRPAGDALPCLVSVYPLRVTGLADRFPERKQRRRKWFDAAKAARKVAEPELRQMLDHLAAPQDALVLRAPVADGA